MTKQENRWEKSNVAYANYVSYLDRKPEQERFTLTLIDLLYVSNFKAGNASICEDEASVNSKLNAYSEKLAQIFDEFGNRKLQDLSLDLDEVKSLQCHAKKFLLLSLPKSKKSVDGFGASYASTLLHFHFRELLPILDRRVLSGAGITVALDSQGQVKQIEQHYPELINRFHEELARCNRSVRELDKEWFSLPLNYRVKVRSGNDSFTGRFHRDDGWWTAWVEELPGANTQGETLDEARENLKEAIELILEINRSRAVQRTADSEYIREPVVVG